MDDLLTEQLTLKLEAVLTDLRAGKPFSVGTHPELLVLMLGMSSADAVDVPDNNSWRELGQGLAATLAELFASVEQSHLKALAVRYVKEYREFLARRESMIAQAGTS